MASTVKNGINHYEMEISFRCTDKPMGWCDLVPFLHEKKANIPTLGPRFLVKFQRVGKAIEVKCLTYAKGPPPLSGLTLIDALLISWWINTTCAILGHTCMILQWVIPENVCTLPQVVSWNSEEEGDFWTEILKAWKRVGWEEGLCNLEFQKNGGFQLRISRGGRLQK